MVQDAKLCKPMCDLFLTHRHDAFFTPQPFTCKVSTFTSQKKPLGRHQRPTKCPVAQEDLTVRARATDGRNAAAAAHSGQKGRDLRALDAKSSCTSANEVRLSSSIIHNDAANWFSLQLTAVFPLCSCSV